MIAITLLLVLTAIPTDQALTDQVDLVEVNHLYDKDGRHVIDQLIFYEWDRPQARFQVVAWRLIKSDVQLPVRDWNRGGYVCHWRDMHVLRKVWARQKRVTWTTYDPEVLEREILPTEFRRELTKRPETQWQ